MPALPWRLVGVPRRSLCPGAGLRGRLVAVPRPLTLRRRRCLILARWRCPGLHLGALPRPLTLRHIGRGHRRRAEQRRSGSPRGRGHSVAHLALPDLGWVHHGCEAQPSFVPCPHRNVRQARPSFARIVPSELDDLRVGLGLQHLLGARCPGPLRLHGRRGLHCNFHGRLHGAVHRQPVGLHNC